jgi:hypothetical protein
VINQQKPDAIVRTTVRIKLPLWVRAKKRAAAKRTTIQQLIATGLQLVLSAKP